MVSQANAVTVFFGDHQGNVGSYDTVMTVLSALGSASIAGNVGQVIGLAYDPATDSVLALDRGGSNIFSIDAGTGVASVLLHGPLAFQFQGGAVKNGILYGVRETTQQLEPINLTTLAAVTLGGSTLPGHNHGLGIDAVTGQKYSGDDTIGGIFTVSDTGVAGSSTPSNPGIEDLEYFGGDFLVASYTQELFLVDGVTGATSVFLTAAQIDSVGVTGNMSGVTLEAILVPGAFGMMGLGIVAFGMVARKRRAASNA